MQPIINTWDDLNLKTDLLRGIYSYGFENPSDIQKKAIYPIINKNDVIAQAQSGSGKTGTFSISALQLVDTSINETQILIIAPTRELAVQIYNVITNIGINMNELRVKSLVGGSSVKNDMYQMRKHIPHIIVGCAGRIFDMIRRNRINMETVRLFILDEADEMLSGGFKDQIHEIFKRFNSNVQVAIFSATMPEEVLLLTDKFMRTPVKIIVKKEELTLECIEQKYVALYSDEDKFEMLKNIFDMISMNQCIIYCNSSRRVNELYNIMNTNGFSVSAINSSMEKTDREAVFKTFRSGGSRVLISSDVTARGIDIQQVSTVINFDVPNNVHTYLHRIGRSGRWGRKGLAINFITKRDINQMKIIEKHYNINITELLSR